MLFFPPALIARHDRDAVRYSHASRVTETPRWTSSLITASLCCANNAEFGSVVRQTQQKRFVRALIDQAENMTRVCTEARDTHEQFIQNKSNTLVSVGGWMGGGAGGKGWGGGLGGGGVLSIVRYDCISRITP